MALKQEEAKLEIAAMLHADAQKTCKLCEYHAWSSAKHIEKSVT